MYDDVIKISLRTERFEASFLEPFQLMLAGVHLGVTGIIGMGEGWQRALVVCVVFLPVSAVLSALAVKLVNAGFRFSAGPAGIEGFDSWWRRRTIDWHDIKCVRTFNFFGLRYLRIWDRESRWPIWLPVFVRRGEELYELIVANVGPQHPLADQFESSLG